MINQSIYFTKFTVKNLKNMFLNGNYQEYYMINDGP